jgi:hypothetical protein
MGILYMSDLLSIKMERTHEDTLPNEASCARNYFLSNRVLNPDLCDNRSYFLFIHCKQFVPHLHRMRSLCTEPLCLVWWNWPLLVGRWRNRKLLPREGSRLLQQGAESNCQDTTWWHSQNKIHLISINSYWVIISARTLIIVNQICRVNPRYNGLGWPGAGCSLPPMSAITELMEYSRKYTIGYIANTQNKCRNTQCDCVKFLYSD